MPKPSHIELGDGTRIPILYEDRSVLAIDKPAGWMLVPYSWQRTSRNLQAALVSSLAAGHFWARARGLKFLRYIHRLDAETTGILLLARSQGALDTLGELFETRRIEKTYLAVVQGLPKETQWTCHLKLAPDPRRVGRMKVDARAGKEAETRFRILARGADTTLLEATPITGRTHQIRLHLAAGGHPVVGDPLYGQEGKAVRRIPSVEFPLGLRAIALNYLDPFTRRPVAIRASEEAFLRAFDFVGVDRGGDPAPSRGNIRAARD